FVDFTGTLLRKGDHIASLYSPEFRAAQEELLSNYRSYQKALATRDQLNIRLEKQKLEASKKKLKLWDLTDSQVEEILREKHVRDHITIYATSGGTVIHKRATVGMYVKEGEKLYTLADLKRVWLVLDAYETDLPWLYLGQKVEFEVEAYPGRIFSGRVAFIDPIINPATRTVKVRLDVHNDDYLLKPEMLARAKVYSLVGENGMAIDTELAGKWVCPMHPYEVAEARGRCPICGMSLVPAEELRLVRGANQRSRVLTIPATAPLITGKRGVVYVESQEDKLWRYEGRVVTLGPRVVDRRGREYFMVLAGLEEGEMVVIEGNFKLDADLQIKAKPSMMSPPNEKKKKKR
ncbi:MAG: HlyD family efflux transporter periplasmic adaptor subunit, partial [Planctomycetota bacterium]